MSDINCVWHIQRRLQALAQFWLPKTSIIIGAKERVQYELTVWDSAVYWWNPREQALGWILLRPEMLVSIMINAAQKQQDMIRFNSFSLTILGRNFLRSTHGRFSKISLNNLRPLFRYTLLDCILAVLHFQDSDSWKLFLNRDHFFQTNSQVEIYSLSNELFRYLSHILTCHQKYFVY